VKGNAGLTVEQKENILWTSKTFSGAPTNGAAGTFR
jgi:hypothetical protein